MHPSALSFLSAFKTYREIDLIFWERSVAFETHGVHDAARFESRRTLTRLPDAVLYWSIDARALTDGGGLHVHAGVHWHGGERESHVQVTHDERKQEWFVTAYVLGGVTPDALFALAGDLGVERNRAKRISPEEAHERIGMIAEFAKRRL